jgi:two-component system phosphate regulon sensor histidine kinase PhoR
LKARFPWQIFVRVVLVQSGIVLAAVAASGLTARLLFERLTLEQGRAHLATALRALDTQNLGSGWCASHSSAGLRLTLLDVTGREICRGDRNRLDDTDELRAERAVEGTMFVIRGAFPSEGLESGLRTLDASLLAFLVGMSAILGLLALWSGRALVFPLGRMLLKARGEGAPLEPKDALREESFGEWSELESSIDDIRRDLRAQAERLNVEREELSTLMSAISDAILAVDTEGRPLFFNSRLALLFGNPQALRDRTVCLGEMVRSPEILDAFRRALASGQPGDVGAIPWEREGEGRRFYSVAVSALRNRQGDIYGAVGVFHDVTELKGAEQIRIDFVANVSHELRTPLTSIKGYTDTLLLDVQGGKPAELDFLTTISRNVDRLMNLIRDLLDLSSIESTDVIQSAEVSTSEITARIVRQLSPTFEAKRQRVLEEIEEPTVSADARRLEQVLVNLLENASKYTPEGGEIRVRWLAESGVVLLRVSDNGPGIPREHHGRLFERFYRVDKARSREQGGTGLGLAIVKHIMLRHGGTVSVESLPGQGAAFTCRFLA